MVRKKLPDFSKKIQSLNAFFETWGPVSLTLILYVGIRNYIVEARYIPSGSIHARDQVFPFLPKNTLAYR